MRNRGFTRGELVVALVTVAIVAVFAIPVLHDARLANRRAESESAAIGNLRDICDAETVYCAESKSGYYATNFEELAKLDPPVDWYASGNGYVFALGARADGFTVIATPSTSDATVWRHFYVDEKGIIRWNIGKPADAKSPRIPGSE